MDDEIVSMRVNYVWDLVELLPRHKTIWIKWFFKINCKMGGSIDQYKSYLVAKGYTYQKSVDYEETFSMLLGLF